MRRTLAKKGKKDIEGKRDVGSKHLEKARGEERSPEVRGERGPKRKRKPQTERAREGT
jgi:hypothetical protein